MHSLSRRLLGVVAPKPEAVTRRFRVLAKRGLAFPNARLSLDGLGPSGGWRLQRGVGRPLTRAAVCDIDEGVS
jgi:hypothetical protein